MGPDADVGCGRWRWAKYLHIADEHRASKRGKPSLHTQKTETIGFNCFYVSD
jgi:hypothetical protein